LLKTTKKLKQNKHFEISNVYELHIENFIIIFYREKLTYLIAHWKKNIPATSKNTN